MRYVQRALRLGVTRRPVSCLGPAARATELSIEFDGASAELLPNDAFEDALHRHVQHLGGVPFDATDQERARKFLATCTPSEIDRIGCAPVLPPTIRGCSTTASSRWAARCHGTR
ncbi:hypothetical protein [Streptomyces spiralis]|uniref:hypothetical protein n=1 Tax=Streptomyces spiralis TaxID=66376 RepID=UPI0033E90745